MFDSLARCARELRDDAVVYPGHDYNGASSTVAREKREGMLRPFTKTQWMAMHAR
jgi:glyoxylase-like metal-dependent hydrolase (beta-lactamase superfamily II)